MYGWMDGWMEWNWVRIKIVNEDEGLLRYLRKYGRSQVAAEWGLGSRCKNGMEGGWC